MKAADCSGEVGRKLETTPTFRERMPSITKKKEKGVRGASTIKKRGGGG